MASASNRFFTCTVFLLLVLGAACTSEAGSDLGARQVEVAKVGAEVMPFDLDQTTHIFTSTEFGGIQDVVADDASDSATIDQIWLHLAEEAEKFAAGDFSDPEKIHGASMPGLAVLKDRYAEIDIDLTKTSVGATLKYESEDAELVRAIHDWFAAQTSDHGSHAEAN